jgi:hypothetical protein
MIASVSRARHRPEYDNAVDNNYTLALLCCGCQTLIDLNRRYKLNDPLVPTWQKTLDDFVVYSIDENGLRIGANESFTRSHRHWAHMLMIHPLQIMTEHQPENRSVSPVPRPGLRIKLIQVPGGGQSNWPDLLRVLPRDWRRR